MPHRGDGTARVVGMFEEGGVQRRRLSITSVGREVREQVEVVSRPPAGRGDEMVGLVMRLGQSIGRSLVSLLSLPSAYTRAAAQTNERRHGSLTGGRAGRWDHSHSIVPGGLLVTSRTTRFTSATSLVMRVEIFASVSYGSRDQSAVMASSEETGRSTIG